MSKRKITKEEVKQKFDQFIAQHGRGPTVIEIDNDPHFHFSARTLQRRFGGAQRLRAEFGLQVTNFNQGETRIVTSKLVNERSLKIKSELYIKLIKKFGRDKVFHRYTYMLDNRGFSDFAIFNRKKDNIDIIDFFYANSRQSLYGCSQHLKEKYPENIQDHFPDHNITFWRVSANEELDIPSANNSVISYKDFLTAMSLQ